MLLRLELILLLTILLNAPVTAQEQRGVQPLKGEYTGTVKAVVVGISDYQNIDKLKFADDDAKQFAVFLQQHPHITSENIKLILDSAATKSNIETAIYEALSNSAPSDQVIIYFAGHGDANTDDKLVDSGYLLCYGVEEHIDYEISQAVKVNTIKEWVTEATSKGIFVVLVIDACRSGKFMVNRLSTAGRTLQALVDDWNNSIKLISCQPEQLAFEGERWGGGHGVFTHYLLEGLNGAAVAYEEGKNITVHDLFEYVEEKTFEDTKREQLPSISGNTLRVFLKYAPDKRAQLVEPKVSNMQQYTASPQPAVSDSPVVKIRELFIQFDQALKEDWLLESEEGKSALELLEEIRKVASPKEVKESDADMGAALRAKLQTVLNAILKGEYFSIPIVQMQEAIKCAEVLVNGFDLIPTEKEELLIRMKLLEGYQIIINNQRNKFPDAMQMFQDIRTKQPQSAYIYNAIGLLYNLQGNYDSTLFYLNKGKELAIQWSEPVVNKSNMYARVAKYDSALAEISTVYNGNYGIHQSAFNMLESILQNLKEFSTLEFDKSKNLLFSLEKPLLSDDNNLSDSNAELYLRLAWLYNELEMYDKSEQLLRIVLQNEEKITRLQHMEGLILMAEIKISKADFAMADSLLGDVQVKDQKILQTNHQLTANLYFAQAQLSKERGNYTEAATHCEKAGTVLEEHVNNNHLQYLKIKSYLAEVYELKGEYKKGLNLLLELQDAYALHYENASIEYTHLIHRTGNLYMAMGNYQEAESLLVKSRNDIKLLLGKTSLSYVTSINNLAMLYESMGRYAEAEALYQDTFLNIMFPLDSDETRSIRAYQLGVKPVSTVSILYKNHREYRKYLYGLAKLYYSMGRYAEAESLYMEGIQITVSVLGINHPDYGIMLNRLANLYESIGRYAEAEPLYKEALHIKELALGKDHPDYAVSLSNLANLYRSMGRYAEAEPIYKEALRNEELTLGKDHPDYGVLINRLATLYEHMGRYAEAEPLYQEALHIKALALGKDHPSYGTSLNNLAVLYESMGRYAEAEPLYREALQNKASALGKDHPSYATSLNNLADLYQSMGRYAEAEALYKEALQITEIALGNDHPDYGKYLNGLANLFKLMGRYTEAEPLYQEALKILKITLGDTHPDYGKVLNNLADLYYSMERYDKAEPLLIQAQDIYIYQLKNIIPSLSVNEKEQYFNTIKYNFEYFYSFALQREINNPAITARVYENILLLKSMLLQSSLDMRQNILQSEDSALLQAYDGWIAIKNQLSKLYALPIKERFVSTDSLESLANDLEKQLNRRASVFREQVQWEDVKKSLGENEAAIEFISFDYYNGKEWTDSTLYAALVLRAEDEYPHMIELFEEKQLQQLLVKSTTSDAGFIGDLYAARGVGVVNAGQTFKGDSLYQLIWQPFDSLLDGVQTVYLSPSGLLHQIAFVALPTPEKGQLLMDRYQLNQLSSTRLLVQENISPSNRPLSIALFGGINYDTSELLAVADSLKNQSHPLAFLPGTKEEVNNIAQKFTEQGISTQLFSGSAALEEQFKQLGAGTSPTILHIATHGFFFPDVKDTLQRNELLTSFNEQQQQVYRITDDPLRRAGLLMAGANHAWLGGTIPQGLEDGILTAYEISSLNLSNTKLVVLSGSETGLGQIQGSEGVYGLQRAFKMAGVKYLIMSLWNVPDTETQEMMELFYQYYLQDQLSIREAFRKTQQQMREKYDPYFWAAFVLVE